MVRRMVQIAIAGFVGVMAVAWVSCGGDVRSDPWLVEKFKEIDGQLTGTKGLPAKVQDLNADVASLRDDIARLRGVGGATTTPIALANSVRLLTQRLADIEARLQAVEAAVKGKAAIAPPKPTPTPAVPTPAPKVTPIVLRTTPPPKATTATAPSVKPTPKPGAAKVVKPVEQPGALGGFYYVAAQGDTAKSVAAKFNISVEEFCKANTFIKPDSFLFPGQNYWIPTPAK